MKTAESFRPISNTPPSGILGSAKFYGRMLPDLQVWSVFRDVKRLMRHVHGDVLDVGCGMSPYRFLVDHKGARYVGIDILETDGFGVANHAVVPFDGERIPFSDDHFDIVLCTEVLEHVQNFQVLVDEIRRVMKPGARALFTVPWSARYHYIPYDFYRYTPSSLADIFSAYSDVTITPRGTDVAVIGSKVVVLWFRNLLPATRWRLVFTPLWALATPLVVAALLIAHLCILWPIGSVDDPLGYTITAGK
jgi:SAM-dependent methyltransferase